MDTRRSQTDELVIEDIYYRSQSCVIPFQLSNKTTLEKEDANTLNISRMPHREKRINNFVSMLNNKRWMKHLSPAISIEKNNIRFDFNISEAYARNTFLADAPPALFSFSLTHGRVYLHNIRFDMTTSFYRSLGYNEEQIDKAIKTIRSKGFSPNQFVDYLNFYYKETKKDIKQRLNIKYNKRMFIQTILMNKLKDVSLTKPKYQANSYHVLYGEPNLWLPYLAKDVHIDNLSYIFTECITVASKESNSLHSITEYSPEDIAEAGKFPNEWFKGIFPKPVTVV